MTIPLHGLAFFWLMLAMYAMSGQSVSNALTLNSASALLAVTVIAMLATLRVVAVRQFSLYGVTFVAMAAFTAAQAFVLLFVPHDEPTLAGLLLTSRFAPDAIVQTFAVTGCFLTALHAGASLAGAGTSTTRRPGKNNVVGLEAWVARVATVAFVASAPFAIARDLEFLSIAANEGYFNLYDPSQAQTQSISLTLASFSVPMAIYVLVLRSDLFRTLAIAFLLVHSLLMLGVGHRGWGLLSLLALAWVYRRVIGRIPNALLIAASVALIAILPVIALVRNTPLSELTVAELATAYTGIKSPLWALLSEMGLSASTIAWTIELIPAERPFGLGMSFLYSVTAALPNLLFDVHPATANSLSNWLTWRIIPEQAAQGAGLGFSAFAEFYYNFGATFGAAAAYGFGYVVSRISKSAELRTHSLLNVAICGVLLSFLPFFARADSSMLLRPVVWYVLLPIGVAYVLGAVGTVGRLSRQ